MMCRALGSIPVLQKKKKKNGAEGLLTLYVSGKVLRLGGVREVGGLVKS